MRSIATVVFLFTVLNVANLYALPKDKSWQSGIKSVELRKAKDAVFLIDKGWVSGKLVKADEESVVIETRGKEETIPRKEVSLIELSDFINPDKREAKNELKLRIRIEGNSECGNLIFNDGTIIKSVEAEPKFTKGGDGDDKASTSAIGVHFDKRGQDRSITAMQTDVTLIPGNANTLSCEYHNNRANGVAGKTKVTFLNPETGKPVAAMKDDISDIWERFTIPIKKLQDTKKTRIEKVPCKKSRLKRIKTNMPKPITSKINARVYLFNGKMVEGKLVAIDEKDAKILTPMKKKRTIPRTQVASIELYDWAADYLKKKKKSGKGDNTSKPIRIMFSGTSSVGYINLPEGDTIDKLIMPPHYTVGRDYNDIGYVNSESNIGFDKKSLDRSITQASAIVIFKMNPRSKKKIQMGNHYTNILAGDMDVFMLDAVTGKKISVVNSKNRQKWDEKFVRGRMK